MPTKTETKPAKDTTKKGSAGDADKKDAKKTAGEEKKDKGKK
eukprot:CAMPEP_0206043734 /NCGR_PEP_ID=MMETSP1466-20131121/10124_1 /ASSEMBLY_ACC=CAM_ASM_001126 /TAXON_ID=44452 /ORGANISM="Pavlova gyrans, Strain CCMP608" /LENGTH=41 /DNA_ID= /DNA_START= /DNA_END= /DNA_ORIENTATION=